MVENTKPNGSKIVSVGFRNCNGSNVVEVPLAEAKSYYERTSERVVRAYFSDGTWAYARRSADGVIAGTSLRVTW